MILRERHDPERVHAGRHSCLHSGADDKKPVRDGGFWDGMHGLTQAAVTPLKLLV
jgi:hypothetical protein